MQYDPYMHEIGNALTPSKYDIYMPDPLLQTLIDRYFVLSDEHLYPENFEWYILPDCNAHLIFYLFDRNGTIVPEWRLIGPRSKHIVINRKHRLFTFCCSFNPGGLSPFINVPMSQLIDRPTSILDLFNGETEKIFDLLTECAINQDIHGFVRHLESFLLTRLSASNKVHKVVDGIFAEYSNTESKAQLASISKRLGYSERHLRNLIKQHIGHSPKLVSQIERFTCSLKHSGPGADWASIAYSCGYYDQSHMISDYQKLVGTSPERLFS